MIASGTTERTSMNPAARARGETGATPPSGTALAGAADITASEAKPVFVDSHATLPDASQGLHDPELDIAELGLAHPLGDPEPEPHADLAATPLADTPHAAHPHHHLPPHAVSPTNAALADLNKDEFQGRLAGIKRDVQALNDRLTDFEAELDKDRVRSPRA